MLVVRRPDTGLLAGQFEFPFAVLHAGASALSQLPSDPTIDQAVDELLNSALANCLSSSSTSDWKSNTVHRERHSSFVHVFSHLRQTSILQHLHLSVPSVILDGQSIGVTLPVGSSLAVDDEDDHDDDQEDEDDEEKPKKNIKSNAKKSTKSTKASSSSKQLSTSSPPVFMAQWMKWSSLRAIGVTLSSFKALEQITQQPWQSKSVRAAAASSSSPASKSSKTKTKPQEDDEVFVLPASSSSPIASSADSKKRPPPVSALSSSKAAPASKKPKAATQPSVASFFKKP